tara:strand:+ start:142 stop:426 length:285 start_codon:yes stop_codon:yes gene_type:complete
LIFPNTYDPYGSLEAEEINDEVLGESHEHETDSIDVGSTEVYTEEKEPSKDSVSYHIENRKKILEERIKNESSINLISFGIIAGVGILILKRYL